MEKWLNAIFPPKCVFCNEFGYVFCDLCLGKCRPLNKTFCIGDLSVYCCFEYEGLVRKCVKKAKYSSRQFAALKVLVKRGICTAKVPSRFVVMPIPLSKEKVKARGFNQAHIIACILSEKLELPYQNSNLIRIKDTKAQYTLGRKRRMDNLKGAFQVMGDVSSLSVLLVDDVCTSGATFLEASRVLYAAGVKEVRCFALSKKL